MAVPAESPRDMPAIHRLVPRDNVFDCAGENVPIVRQTRCEGGAIVENILWLVLRQAELRVEGVDSLPQLQDILLLPWEREVLPIADLLHGGAQTAPAAVPARVLRGAKNGGDEASVRSVIGSLQFIVIGSVSDQPGPS